MMVGHAMLAFAIGASLASRRWPRGRALAFGVVAGAFAAVPDVDMLYALFGLAQVGFAGVWTMTAAFWGSSQVVHRAVTHSLVVGCLASVAFAGIVAKRGQSSADRERSVGNWGRSFANRGQLFAYWGRSLAALLLAGLTAVAFFESGLLGGAIMLAFLIAGVGVAIVAAKAVDFGPRTILAAALLGLLSHPFGDVFTGAPPRFFYPFDAVVLTERVTLLADPTLNLLAVFAVELATLWFAGSVYLRLTERRLLSHVDARAAVGVAYSIAVVAMPAPTMQVSYHFVFSILALGIVGVAPHLLPSRPLLSAEWHETITWGLTGLAAVSVAALAYTLTYIIYPVS